MACWLVGVYTVIASTYHRGMLGRFLCSLRCSAPSFGIAEIAPEGCPVRKSGHVFQCVSVRVYV